MKNSWFILVFILSVCYLYPVFFFFPVKVGLELFPAVTGREREVGYTLDRLPTNLKRMTCRDGQSFTHTLTPTDSFEWPISPASMFLDCSGREGLKYANMQTLRLQGLMIRYWFIKSWDHFLSFFSFLHSFVNWNQAMWEACTCKRLKHILMWLLQSVVQRSAWCRYSSVSCN